MSKRHLLRESVGLSGGHTVGRRDFLKRLGLLGAGVASLGAVRPLLRSLDYTGQGDAHSHARTAMGTRVRVKIAADSRDLAAAASAAAFAEMDRLIAIFSRHDEASALSELNRQGELPAPPPELVTVLAHGCELHRLTSGAFDPTVKPLVDVLESARAGSAPNESAIRNALSRVDATRVAIANHGIQFQGERMGVTLDGVAKGFIVDRMSDVLAAAGAHSHLVEAGGDIRTRSRSGRPWTIAIQDPRKRGNYPDVIEMHNGAIATSGGYERVFDATSGLHHIVDPASGASPAHAVSASVRAATVMQADALATAVFVMGADAGLALVDRVPDGAGLVVDHTGAQYRSRRWPVALS